MENKIKIYSFFSGCGLLDLGLENAGFNIAMVSEKYEPFLDAYKYSRKKLEKTKPEYGYFKNDIQNYLDDVSLLGNIIRNECDDTIIGFVGGPPCPDFSIAGKNKGIYGENGKLSEVYFNLIEKYTPDFFIFENVKGLWKTKKHKEFYSKMYKKMEKNGYYVFDKLLNSLYYGVPQNRERIMMIGIRISNRKNKKEIEYLISKFNWGLKNFNFLEKIKKVNWPLTNPFEENSKIDMPKGIIKNLTVQYWFDKNNVESHFNSQDYFLPRSGLEKMKIIEEGDVSKKSYKRLHRWRYSPTAAYGNNEVHLHPYKTRRLSIAEVLAIQSAPKKFELPKTMSLTDMFKTVGNGVPVLMMEKIAKELKKLLEECIDIGRENVVY